ncbi:MAG: segregation/condensation protein A [Anaerolineae bacterium]|nr:segregation/condensation protein A [Anaerolineae bacterium]
MEQPTGAQPPTYQVKLEVFEGPLDLLLKLVEQEALDITLISLARVTDQYLAYLRVVEKVRPNDLADFMVIAARLLLIKSRMLLPRPPKIIEEEEDVGDDLVRQLREYMVFKRAAQFLAGREQAGARMYPRTVPVSRLTQNLKARLDLGDACVDDLIAALRALLDQPVGVEGTINVVPYQVTIEHKIEQITRCLAERSDLTFRSLLDDGTSRIEVIVTLLAVLELIRTRRITVHQEQLFGEIVISSAERPQGFTNL